MKYAVCLSTMTHINWMDIDNLRRYLNLYWSMICYSTRTHAVKFELDNIILTFFIMGLNEAIIRYALSENACKIFHCSDRNSFTQSEEISCLSFIFISNYFLSLKNVSHANNKRYLFPFTTWMASSWGAQSHFTHFAC